MTDISLYARIGVLLETSRPPLERIGAALRLYEVGVAARPPFPFVVQRAVGDGRELVQTMDDRGRLRWSEEEDQ